ncbi:MAG: hypothetical protein COU07_02690 [Candidatus Harrisonbacteria bacterium CG10_big_fil_rev_8_21_14_0_10_40_38]|uniref:Small ribosomal subunit protein bS21 n=1 Tax=Candidatus Harrisonbacteria bacterium CG10_big_fil_rev_8_21_14_0_10_40_38 TaxID=1974583 RepID=A0A2H0URR1_9BACT|nr:MAG: hypothetical protein COU07_02690 [Candidatus Harrisonbacteria bacterium CG10_big_fil_rev_8_21_14_0_10_40_38]
MKSVDVRRKEGETSNALIYRFLKKTQQSGVLKEAKKRRFHSRPESKIKRRQSAIHRSKKRVEYEKAKKMGIS